MTAASAGSRKSWPRPRATNEAEPRTMIIPGKSVAPDLRLATSDLPRGTRERLREVASRMVGKERDHPHVTSMAPMAIVALVAMMHLL